MGVLNVTPDSFSDGGAHLDPGAAIAGRPGDGRGRRRHRRRRRREHPAGRAPVPPAIEEQARVLPVIRALAAAGLRVSIDTRHAATMAAALDAGAAIVNDVSALAHDPAAARRWSRRAAARSC